MAASILPAIEFGKEVAWVLRPSEICAGRIGYTVKGCLKSIGDCAVEAHSRSKSVFPAKPFLIHLSGAPAAARGFDKVLLEIDGLLDKALVTDFMSRTGENWSREFEEVRVNHTKTIQDRDAAKELMRTVRKPKQPKASGNSLSLKKDYKSNMDFFTDAHVLVTSLEKKRLTADGTLKPMSLEFSEASYIEATKSLIYYVDILAEVSGCVTEVFAATPGLIEDYVTPVE